MAGECGYTPPQAPMGLCFGDLDHDGKIDFFSTATYPETQAVLDGVV